MKDHTQYHISKDGDLYTIEIESERFHFMRYYRLIFLPIFLILLGILTGIFLNVLAISVIFTIPFWFAIFLMTIGNINSFNETQTIRINNKHIEIEKCRPIWPIKYQIPISEIKQIKLVQLEIGFGKKYDKENWLIWLKGFKNFVELPTITTSTRNYCFYDYADSKQNKKALTNFIEDIILKKNNMA